MFFGWPLSIAWHLLPFQIDAIDSIRSILCEHDFEHWNCRIYLYTYIHSTYPKNHHVIIIDSGTTEAVRFCATIRMFLLSQYALHSAKNVWLIEINYNFESEKIIGKKLKLCLILCMYREHIYNIHYKLVRVCFAFTFAPLTFRLTHFAFVYHSMAVILVQRTLLIITMCRAHPKRKRAKKTLKLKIYGWALVAKPTAAWQQQSKYSNVNDLIG